MDATVVLPLDLVSSKIKVGLPQPIGERLLTIVDPKVKWKLAEAEYGDILRIQVDNAADPKTIAAVDAMHRPVPLPIRLVVFAISTVVLLLLATLMTGGKPQRFILGADNRYSNSLTQAGAWFGALAVVYMSAVVLRIFYLHTGYIGGVGLPEHLIELTGLSALAFGGAKVITAQKVDTAEAAGQSNSKPAAKQPNFLLDLVTNDYGRPDFGDFQMILITGAAVVIFMMSAGYFLGSLAFETNVTLPDVDTTLLSAFGIGQGAYLVKKAAAKLGQG